MEKDNIIDSLEGGYKNKLKPQTLNTQKEIVGNLDILNYPEKYNYYISQNIIKFKNILKDLINSQTNFNIGISEDFFYFASNISQKRKDLFLKKLGYYLGSQNNLQPITLSGSGILIQFFIDSEPYYFIPNFEYINSLWLNEAQLNSLIKLNKYQFTYDFSKAWEYVNYLINQLMFSGIHKSIVFNKRKLFVKSNNLKITTNQKDLDSHLEYLYIYTSQIQSINNVNLIGNLIIAINELQNYDDGYVDKLPLISNVGISDYLKSNFSIINQLFNKFISLNNGKIDLQRLKMHFFQTLINSSEYSKIDIELNSYFDSYSDGHSLGNFDNNANNGGTFHNIFNFHKYDKDFGYSGPQNSDNLSPTFNEDLLGESDKITYDMSFYIDNLIDIFLNKIALKNQEFICIDPRYEIVVLEGGIYQINYMFGYKQSILLTKEKFSIFCKRNNINFIYKIDDLKHIIEAKFSALLHQGNNKDLLIGYFLSLFYVQTGFDNEDIKPSFNNIINKLKKFYKSPITLSSKFYLEKVYLSLLELEDLVGTKKIPVPTGIQFDNLYDYIIQYKLLIQTKICKKVSHKGLLQQSKILNIEDFNGYIDDEGIAKITQKFFEIALWTCSNPIGMNIESNINLLGITINGLRFYLLKKNDINNEGNYFQLGNYEFVFSENGLNSFFNTNNKPFIINNNTDGALLIDQLINKISLKNTTGELLKKELEIVIEKTINDFIECFKTITNEKINQVFNEYYLESLSIPHFLYEEIYSIDELMLALNNVVSKDTYNYYLINGLIKTLLIALENLQTKYHNENNTYN